MVPYLVMNKPIVLEGVSVLQVIWLSSKSQPTVLLDERRVLVDNAPDRVRRYCRHGEALYKTNENR